MHSSGRRERLVKDEPSRWAADARVYTPRAADPQRLDRISAHAHDESAPRRRDRGAAAARRLAASLRARHRRAGPARRSLHLVRATRFDESTRLGGARAGDRGCGRLRRLEGTRQTATWTGYLLVRPLDALVHASRSRSWRRRRARSRSSRRRARPTPTACASCSSTSACRSRWSILSITAVPIYHRLKVYTAYEYLETRFDVRTRTPRRDPVPDPARPGTGHHASTRRRSSSRSILGWTSSLTNSRIGVAGHHLHRRRAARRR